jgi:hypothetical protein
MSALVSNYVYDLMSWGKTRAPDFKTSFIAQLLAQSNELMYDMTYLEANEPNGHLLTDQTALPTTYTTQFNQTTQVTRGQTAQREETLAQFKTWAQYDVDLINKWADKGQFLVEMSRFYLESIIEKFCGTFWYGDTSTDATEFTGMAPRYATVNSANAYNAQNCIDGGGTGSVNTSVWLLTWSPTSLHGIYPRGSQAGIQHYANPDFVVQGSNGFGQTLARAHIEEWKMDAGIALVDWRWCGRLCNIDSTNLKNQSGATDLTDGMIDLMNRLPSLADPPVETGNPMTNFAPPGKRAFYMNRPTRAALHKQMLNKTNNQLQMSDWYGMKVMTFMGIPIRCSDQITNAEARVV